MEKTEDKMTQENPEIFPVVKRKITVNNTKIYLKSVFTNQINLEDALKNIVIRKMNFQPFTESSLIQKYR